MSQHTEWNARVLERLNELGLTQDEFAKVLGISPQRLSNYIHGRRSPNPALLCQIIRELGVTADWLLLGIRNKHIGSSRRPGSIEAKFNRLSPQDRTRIENVIDVLNLGRDCLPNSKQPGTMAGQGINPLTLEKELDNGKDQRNLPEGR